MYLAKELNIKNKKSFLDEFLDTYLFIYLLELVWN